MRTQEERDEQTLDIAMMVFGAAVIGVAIVFVVFVAYVLVGD